MEPRISLVTLGVADVERSRSFYEALGWEGETPDGGVYFFQVGAQVVAVWDRTRLAEDSCVTDSGGWGGITLAHNVGGPDEVDEVLDAAVAAGATLGRGGAANFWGGYSGVFIDPDGHPWEVAHNPDWPIHSDGSVTLH